MKTTTTFLWLLLAASLLALSMQAQTIRYVKAGATGNGSSWAAASGDLQAMISVSNTTDQVWVAQGVYKPTSGNDRTISFSLKNGVAIYGGFVGNEQTLSARPAINPVSGPGGVSQPSSTTLSGDIGTIGNTGDNSYHVLNNSGLTASAVLDGFVITGGNAIGSQAFGGGMNNVSSSPTLTNCLFQSNSAVLGGGMYNTTNSNPTLTNCLFKSNTASVGGGMYNSGSNGSSNPVLTNCLFKSNSAGEGGGMYNTVNCNPGLTNCLFQSNSASNVGGGMDNFKSSPILTNCSFVGNSASQGGGMYNSGGSGSSNPVLTNCSFQSNSAGEGGGMYNTMSSNPRLTNCVVFGNGASNTFVNSNASSSVTARYSLLEASVTGYGGDNNLTTSTSPFVSTTSAQLVGTALAINAGSNAAYTSAGGPATDLAGNPRFFKNGTIDMGAYEYQSSLTPPITTNNALHFDGQNDQVAIDQGSTPILNGGDAITIEYWFKGTNSQSAVRLQPNDETYIIAAWHNATHILSNDGGTNGLPVGNGFDDGNWHHIAFSWQRNTANGFKSYLDGRLVAQRNSADTPLPVIASGAGLGAYIRNATEYTAGSLDEVRIWTVARTQAQLQASLCSSTTLGLPQTGLVAYYGFDYGVAGGSNADINTLPNLVDGTTNRGLLSNFALSGATSNWVNGVTSSLSSPARLYVKANASGANTGLDWANAFPDLQSALTYACSGNLSEIWVAQGTYKPTTGNDRTISFSLKNGVAIYGGFVGSETSLSQRPTTFPSTATLSGDIGTSGATGDNSYHVIKASGLTNTALLDGFIIQGGNANSDTPNDRGAGSYTDHSSLRFVRCFFQNNSAVYGGGMIILNDGAGSSASPSLTNCLFASNRSTNQGGGLYNYGAAGGNASPVLTNCSFQSNSATNGGGALYNNGAGGASSPVLTNCSFQGNLSAQGGGMFSEGGSGSSMPSLINCVVFGNGGSNTFVNNDASSSVTARYSLLEASVTGYGGDNNLTTSTSPFASTTSAQLVGTALAINRGSNQEYSSAGGPATDLAGNPRIFPTGGTIDMGAYEYQSSLTPPITTNNALHFDGQNDQVAIDQGNTPILNGGDAITIEYWFKGTNSQSAVRLQPNDETYIIAAWHNATHLLSNDGGTNGLPVGNGFDDGNWHHIAFSWQRNTANGFKSYLDGRLVAQRNSADTPLPVIASGAGLGAYIRNGTEYTAGSLDEVRIWTVARTQAQLQASLCSSTTLGLPQTGLVAYYGFDYGVAGGSNADINTLPNLVDGTTNRGLLSNFALSGATSNWVNGVTSSLSSPARLYVKANASGANTGLDWANAFPDLQSALTYACSGNLSEIWVAAGTYKPTATTDRSISFMMKAGVAIYGGFVGTEQTLSARPAINPITGQPSSSTLSGDIGTLGDANDNSYHVIYNVASLSLTSSARLDGFVITGGNGDGNGQTFGGGMANDSSSPTLANCSFVGNSAGSSGGGMSNQSSSNPSLTNCLFQTNSTGGVGGGMYNGVSSPVLTNCSFVANSADQGGGMLNVFSSPTLANCSFVSNSADTGGGMSNNNGSNPSLTNCSFVGNSAGIGGGMWNNSSSPTLANCSFVSNSAGNEGGGVWNRQSSPSLTNCSFVGNKADQGGGNLLGGGMYNYLNSSPVLTNCSFQANSANVGGGMFNLINSNPILTNCVVFGNGANNTFFNDDSFAGSSVTAHYSLLEGSVSGYGGENNLTTTTTPFAATTSTQLSACSPAINAGSNAAYTALTNPPATDLAGNPRFFNGGQIDMGAYEFQGTPTSLPVSNPAITTATLNQSFSQSFTASGGSEPYSFTLASGSLPTGLSLNLNGQLSGSPTQTGSFTLTVSVTDAAGCSGSGAPYVLTVSDATPTITALAANPAAVCVGSPVTFTASIGNVSGSYGYTLTGGSSLITGSASGSVFSQSLTASGSGSQNYSLTISSPGQSSPGQSSPGQSTSASTSLTVNALPMATLSASPSTTLTCAQSSLTLTSGGGTSYMFSPNVVSQSGNTAVVNASGVYSVTVVSGTGCFSTTSLTISSDASTPTPTLSASPATTLTCAQTSLTLTAGGGSAYVFSPNVVSQSGNRAVVNAAGVYSVTVTNGTTGCSSTTSLTISSDASTPTPTLSASPSTTLTCAQTSLTLTAGGGTSYVFSPNVLSQSGNRAVVNAAGLYSVTVVSGTTGCFSTTSLTISSDASTPTPTLSASPSTTLTCAQTSLTLTAGGGTSYVFSPNVVSQSGNTAVVNTSGVYSVTALSANGCSAVASTTITSNTTLEAPSLVTQSGHPYPGGVHSLTTTQNTVDVILMVSGCANGTITWSGGNSSTLSVSTINTGIQTFTASCSQSSCISPIATATITVVAPTLTVYSRDPDNGQLSTNTLKPYLQLQNDGNTPIPYREITVRYWLTVENPAPLRFDINYAQMGNDNVHLTYVPLSSARQGATGYIEFSFDGSAGSLAGGSNAVIQDLVNKQDYSYFFQGDDYSYANNPNFAANPHITAYRNAVLIYGVEPAVIGGSVTSLSLTASTNPTTLLTTGSIQLQANVSGGTPGYMYTFNGPGTIQPSGNTASVSGLPAGVQTFTVTARDATSPVNQTIATTVSVTVTAPANQTPVASANSNQTATVGQPFSYVVGAFSDDTPNSLTYAASINPANGFTFSPVTRVVQGTPTSTGVSSVTVTATDPPGLSASTIFTITVSPAPPAPTALTLTASASPTIILTTSSTQLLANVSGGTPGYMYTFNGPGTIQPSGNTASVLGLPTGVQTFTVTARDATSPVNQTIATTVSVTVTAPANQTPVASANSNQTATVGQPFSYVVGAFSDDTPNSLTYTASINPANGLTFNPVTRVIQGMPQNTGVSSVTITATDPGGLSASTVFTIIVNAAPVVTDRLTVLSRDPDNGQLSTNTLKPYLQLQNDGNTPIPYREITVRYWLTVENPAPLRFDINYAQMGNDNVHLTYVPLSLARQGATGYIEFSFDGSAGSLAGGSNAVIQDLVNKQDYSYFFQGDDYSYVNNPNFAANPRITAYRNAVLVYGSEPPAGARQGAEQADVPLQVRVLGNPVQGSELSVEVSGAEGQPLHFQLIDLQGRVVTDRLVDVAGPVEQQRLALGHGASSLLLLQVSTPSQRQTVKVIREN